MTVFPFRNRNKSHCTAPPNDVSANSATTSSSTTSSNGKRDHSIVDTSSTDGNSTSVECSISMLTDTTIHSDTSTEAAVVEIDNDNNSNNATPDSTVIAVNTATARTQTTTTSSTINTEELIRFRTVFGGSTLSSSGAAAVMTTTISDLSNEAQRHYTNFQQWKQRHATYLLFQPNNSTTGTTTPPASHTVFDQKDIDLRPLSLQQQQQQKHQYDTMDALEWYNAYRYSIQYHLVLCCHDDDEEEEDDPNHRTTGISNTTNLESDISSFSLSSEPSLPRDHDHFRIIAAPQSARGTTAMMTHHHSPTTTLTTMTTTTKSCNKLQQQQSSNRIIYVLPAGMNITSIPTILPINTKTGREIKNSKKDVSKQMMEVYTTAFAVYIYRTLFVNRNQATTTSFVP